MALDSAPLGAQLWKENDVADRRRVGEQLHETIDADSLARRRRHPVLEGADVVLVHRVRLLVAAATRAQLLLEARALLVGVVQLEEAVRDLAAGDVELEAVDERRVAVAL